MAQATYPVIFTLRDLVYGDGFVAGVTTRGRAVMEQSEDDWWCHGVEPGAITASGSTMKEAHDEFTTALSSVLFDIAGETPGFEQFRAAVTQFFAQKDPTEERRWVEAVEHFRSGNPLPSPVSELPKLPADIGLFIKIENLTDTQSVTAGSNILPQYALPIAA